MNKAIPKRIHIVGSVGSGKTTLAREISSKLGIPYYELDNVVWIRDESGDIRRTDQERETCLNSIIQSESWITEGVHTADWASPCFHRADLIVFLDTKYSIRVYRIGKRFFKQKLRIEESNYKPTREILKKCLNGIGTLRRKEKLTFSISTAYIKIKWLLLIKQN
ncbi:DNA topology modulation protein FlaR [Oceanobacillus jordanicus]|uniref:DNA topology modulation protein FlaR n=1 Tax=Oceanobacillus jordanicus TaxID=2867266 RepID=UPI001EDF4604|nr:DNA topology modulation protein FlaR [Oceanobacillus jordanicus]